MKTDPSGDIALSYHRYIDRCNDDKILDDYEYRSLRIPSDYQLPTIYFLPKMHKHPLKLRPIVASVKGITTNALRFMDKILQPYMKRVRSYSKNATHVVNI